MGQTRALFEDIEFLSAPHLHCANIFLSITVCELAVESSAYQIIA